MTQPRLTGFDGWQRCTSRLPEDSVVEIAECPPPPNLPPEFVSVAVSECDGKMNTPEETFRLLAYVPVCTDAAVEKLETLANGTQNAALLSDLAAGYFLRAQRNDRPADMVRSLATAEQAFNLAPALPEVRFNRALAQEVLGFSNDAIASWDALRKDGGAGWATEAGEHYEKLMSARSRAEAVQWKNNLELLRRAARVNDRAAVTELVDPYRATAHVYVEDTILPAWAQASSEGNAQGAAEQLGLARIIASSLAELTKDRYLLESVELIRTTTSPRVLRLLEQGHRALGMALDRARDFRESAAAYERAEKALEAAGSPVLYTAMVGHAAPLTQRGDYDRALELLGAVERAANARNHPYVLARVHTARAFLRMLQGRHIDAVAAYKEAQSAFDAAEDLENLAKVQIRLTGLYRLIGHDDFTWRAAFQVQRHTNYLDIQSRHSNLGENALSAVKLGYPAIALHYQNEAVRLLEDELSKSQEDDLDHLRGNLGIALRTRAGIRAHLNDAEGAQRDLEAAAPLVAKETDISTGFQARLAEAEAQKLAAANDRRRAIAALSKAIELVSTTQYHSLAASMRAQRARLYRQDGNRTMAEADLLAAIAALHDEERAAVQTPKNSISQAERLWSAYFSRPQDARRALIRHYVDDGRSNEAFWHVERARAYEPLQLVLRRADVPPSFRARIHNGEPFRQEDVQATLPPGTFLLQYSVLDDQTYVWIIGNGKTEFRNLSAGEEQIRQWTRALQKFASLREDAEFRKALVVPYERLLREPLDVVAKLHGKGARVVIVPDRSMHGLPFSALSDGNRHVIQDYVVSVAGSATLYVYSLAQDEQVARARTESILILAGPTIDRHLDAFGINLPDLPGARSEARRIETVYAPAIEVNTRIGKDATVQELLRLAPGSTIIHIAAHGIANPGAPSRSYLLLAPAKNDSGAIDAERLSAQLHLTQTRLAVLSACSSAGGTPVGPEGLAPLVRPLLAGGVPAVIGTLWSVSDSRATEDLLVRFHDLYRKGHDASKALQLAQQEMIAHAQAGHQAVWGWSAFQLTGYASSPFPIPKEREQGGSNE